MSLLDITKKVTDAVQIAGIAFGIVATVLELVKGYREVDNLTRELYQELQQVADELKRLEGRKQTTRMKLDKDSRLSVSTKLALLFLRDTILSKNSLIRIS